MALVKTQKDYIRQEMGEYRKQLKSVDPFADSMICERLYSWEILREGGIVSGYWPLGNELDIRPFLFERQKRNLPVALPCTGNDRDYLTFHLWAPDMPLYRSSWGVMEPDPALPEVIPDVLLIPLLAFDGHGYRLGYGQGHFDRYLECLRKENPEVIAVGIAHEGQKMDVIPHESHDQKLDYVVMPSTIMVFE